MSPIDLMLLFLRERNSGVFSGSEALRKEHLVIACTTLLGWIRRYCRQDRGWVLEVNKANSWIGSIHFLLDMSNFNELFTYVESKYAVYVSFNPNLDESKRKGIVEQVCREYQPVVFPKSS